MNKTLLLVTICLAICVPSAVAFWRLPCVKPITVQRLDPIVNNGTVSSHVHTFLGGSAVHARVTTEQLEQSKCSTCTVLEDNSLYWIGVLYYQHPNGTMESVPQAGGALVYYLQRRDTPQEQIHAFPRGFRMIAGSPFKRTSDNSLESRAITYNCLDYSNPTPETGAFPQKNCPQGLRTQVFFPSCWDGVNLDSPNHKSHMAYPSGLDNGVCPSTHPVRLVSIFFEITWDTGRFADQWIDANGKPKRAMPFIWSFGDNTGYGLHGDFLNGWDVDVLQRAVDDCTSDSGVAEYCEHFTFRTNDAANRCLPDYLPPIEEQIFGSMPRMPNLASIPVATFNPCGTSPANGFDNTVAGQPIGTCTPNATAYTHVNGLMGSNMPVAPLIPVPMPDLIDQTGYIGCFVDGTPTRTMEFQLVGDHYTPATCRAAVQALNAGYIVFGVQYAGECWASTSSTAYTAQGVSTNCDMYCRADSHGWTYCGGSHANQVYHVTV